jgi:FkbM family methyltransferase
MIYLNFKNKIKSIFSKNVMSDKNFVPYKRKFNICDVAFEFWIADSTGKQWYDHGFWNNALEFQMLNKMVKKDYHVLEFGLHHGFSSIFLCKKTGHTGKYMGVEMLPKASIYTMANLKLNEIGSNCRVINAAGGNKHGFILFSNENDANGYVSIDKNGIQIEQITGDSLLPDFNNKIDCLKIDVEGFEINVLEGCKKILSLYPDIDLEIHTESIKVYGNKINRIFELIDLGKYHAYYFWNVGTRYIDPASHKLKKFSLENMPGNGIINLFLFSKERGPVEITVEN